MPRLLPLYIFLRLSPASQLYWVLNHCTHLAQRWEETLIDLYHVADKGRGFFVEVGMAEQSSKPVVLRSFVSTKELEDYAHTVQLPEL